MIGSAGSKYGIVEDGIPLRKDFTDTDAGDKRTDASQRELKDIRSVLRRILQKRRHARRM